jgi:hypothetical protein
MKAKKVHESIINVFKPVKQDIVNKEIKKIKNKFKDVDDLLLNLYIYFLTHGFSVEEDFNSNGIIVKNDNFWGIYFEKEGNTFYCRVPGFKRDIDLDDVGNDFKFLEILAQSIDKKWMIENDPDGDKWIDEVEGDDEY